MIGQYLPNNNENATVVILPKILHLNRALDKELGSQVRCLKSVELTLYFTSINANCIRCCKVGIKAREEHILDVQQELKTTAAYTHSIQSFFCLFVWITCT
jgi:hypothetical protein